MTVAVKTKLAAKARSHGVIDAQPEDAGAQLYREIIRIIERMHRRLLDVVRVELMRLGVEDVSSAQMVMLLNIHGNEVSVRDLIERGYYLGSNASYNLKQLLEAGYINRSASQRDKRAARISLSEKGAELCEELRKVEEVHAGLIVRSKEDVTELETTFRTLRRLEMTWTDVIRYGDAHSL